MRILNNCAICNKYRLCTWTNGQWICSICAKEKTR